MRINPLCNDYRADCHWRNKGECRLLHSTYSVKEECPFFKTTLQFEDGRRKYPLLTVGALNKKERLKPSGSAGGQP